MATLEIYKDTKKELDSISPSMCFAKWKQTTLYLQTGETHSCHLPTPHVVPLHEIEADPSALHNSAFKKQQQQLMLKGIRPEECAYCWSVQDAGKDSFNDRITKSSEPWARPYKDEILAGKSNAPSYLEVSFSTVCNLKCAYCNPYSSSKWMEEVNQHGAYPTVMNYTGLQGKKFYLERDENPYVDAFWKWWPDLYMELKVFRITGGEPLLSKHTFRILDYIAKNPNPELELNINSNLSVPDHLIDLMIEKVTKIVENKCIKKFNVYTSCEAHGEKANYIRFGMDYNKWLANCHKILQGLPATKIGIMSAYNILCVTSFLDFAKDIKQLKEKYSRRVSMDVPFVRKPDYLSVSLVDDTLRPYMEKQLAYFEENFEYYEINRFKRMFSVAKTVESTEVDRKDFCVFIDEYDKRKGTDFFEVFPELELFYYSCMK